VAATLNPAQRLKCHMLAEGVEISPAAARRLHEITDGKLTPADYASTSGLILELQDNVWVNAPINEHNPNFVDRPRSLLDHDSAGFFVRNAAFSSTAKYWQPPSYHGRSGDYGPWMNFAVTHADRARLSPVRGCAMTCKFCNIPYDDPLDVYAVKPIDALIAAAHVAVNDPVQPSHHLLISGGTPKRPDIDALREIYRRVLLEFPQQAVDIMMVPLRGLFDLAELDRLGLNQISINVEIYGAAEAAQLMRNKSHQGLDYYLDFIADAASILGPNRVRSMLMVGLEPMEQTLAGVRMIAERGGVPVLSPFRPDPSTPLRDRRPANAAELEEIYLRAADLVATIGGSLGPDCTPCTHNTLTFPATNSIACKRPRPVMV
jgi:hypothetical protein